MPLGCRIAHLVVPSALFLTGVASAAQGATFELEWEAPPGCPDGGSVRGEVIQLVGTPPAIPRRLEAAGTITDAADGYHLVLRTELDGVEGERTLDARSCGALSKAAALTIALMLNPDVADSAPETSPEPASGNPTEPAYRLAVAGTLGAGFAVLPLPTPELGASVGTDFGPWMVWLEALAGLPQTTRVDGDDAGGRFFPITLRSLGCAALRFGEGELNPCIAAETAWLLGEGAGVEQPRDDVIGWVAVGGGLGASLRVSGPLKLRARAIAAFPLARPSFFIDDLGRLHRPATLTAHGDVGLVVTIW